MRRPQQRAFYQVLAKMCASGEGWRNFDFLNLYFIAWAMLRCALSMGNTNIDARWENLLVLSVECPCFETAKRGAASAVMAQREK